MESSKTNNNVHIHGQDNLTRFTYTGWLTVRAGGSTILGFLHLSDMNERREHKVFISAAILTIDLGRTSLFGTLLI